MPVNSFRDFPMSWKPSKDELGDGPIYLSLAARLEADIRSGALPVGTRLPPQRELADFLDLNFTTVTRAYDLCRAKGLLQGVVGKGTFVAETFSVESEPGYDCAVVQGFPELGARHIAEAARRVLERESAVRLFSYNARDGQPRHLLAGVRWLARCGVTTTPDCLSVFPGVQSALSTALLSLFHPGDALAVDHYTYANLIQLARLAHIRLVPIDGDLSGMKPAALREAAASDRKLKGLYVMPFCANPTTITLSEKRKDDLAAVCREAGLLILEDDSSLAPPKKSARTFAARLPGQTVYLAGSIRTLAPGLRVTYVAYPEHQAGAMRNGLHHLAIKASALEASILSELITSGQAETILEEKRRRATEANEIFNSIFGKERGNEARLFRRLSLPGTTGMGPEIEAKLSKIGVKACHSDRFAVKRGDNPAFLRVSLSSETPARLKKALKLIASFISK